MTKNEAVATGMVFMCAQCHEGYDDLPMDMDVFNISGKDIPTCIFCGSEHFIDLREVDCSAPCLELHNGVIVA